MKYNALNLKFLLEPSSAKFQKCYVTPAIHPPKLYNRIPPPKGAITTK